MRVADAMQRVPVYVGNSAFDQLPLLGNTNTEKTFDDFLVFSKIEKLPPSTAAFSFDFAKSDHGLVADFADLPANYDPAIYALQSGHRPLPDNLGSGKALFISGANSRSALRSGDGSGVCLFRCGRPHGHWWSAG
jgi:hypothetical protein